MRKIFFAVFSFFTLLLLISCEKDLITYKGKEGVYFAVQWGADHGDSTVWAYQHFTPVNFINLPGQQTLVKLRVMATGQAKDYDRSFGLKINLDSSNMEKDVDYEDIPSTVVLPAGHLYVDIPVTVKRTSALQNEMKYLGLNLLASKDFELSVPLWYPLPRHWATERHKIFDATFHKVEMTDFVTRPAGWWGLSNNGVEAGLFGFFTNKKYRLICDLNNLRYDDFASTTTTMPSARANVVNQVVRTYLQNAFDAGSPILEDDGRLMWVSGVTWTSTIGVPYKP